MAAWNHSVPIEYWWKNPKGIRDIDARGKHGKNILRWGYKQKKKRTSISTGRFGTGIEKAKQATNGKPKGEQSTSVFRT